MKRKNCFFSLTRLHTSLLGRLVIGLGLFIMLILVLTSFLKTHQANQTINSYQSDLAKLIVTEWQALSDPYDSAELEAWILRFKPWSNTTAIHVFYPEKGIQLSVDNLSLTDQLQANRMQSLRIPLDDSLSINQAWLQLDFINHDWLDEWITDLWWQLSLILVFIGFLGYTFCQVLSPFNLGFSELKRTLGRVKQGQLASRANLKGSDDFSELGRDLNTILDAMQAKEQMINRSKEALLESNEYVSQILSITEEAIWDWDLISNKATHNANWLKLLGIDSYVESHHRQLFIDMIHEEDLEGFIDQVQRAIDENITYVHEYRVIRADGRIIWIMDRGRVVKRDLTNEPICMMGSFIDVTERRQLDQDLKISAVAFESQDGMLITDSDLRIIKANHAFCQVSGFSFSEIADQSLEMFFAARNAGDIYEAWLVDLHEQGNWQGEVWFSRQSKEEYPVWLRVTPVRNHDKISTYVVAICDISVRVKAQEQIEHLAFYDTLTNLPNRRLLLDRLQQMMAMSKRSGKHCALMFVDLDNFKTLNDTQGHDVGDLLLKTVGERLQNLQRKEDTVSRLGGDEFVVLLGGLASNEDQALIEAEHLANKVLLELNLDYPIADMGYRITPSIGVTIFSGDEVGIDELLKRADIAMYEAKTSGRNTVRFFDPAMQLKVNLQAKLEQDIREGLAKGDFEIFYQPQVDNSGRVFGAEALIRWNHPNRGLLMPDAFMDTVEASEMIYDLGVWVVSSSCNQLSRWKNDPLLSQIKLSVNVSSKQFIHEFFVEQIKQVIAESGANPSQLKIELTETVLIHDVTYVTKKMATLKKLGVGFVLDDFGTGYSSLAYLKMMPIEQLKIDHSFVRDILVDPNDEVIARSIIALSESLGLSVLAEGVETEAQQLKLLEMGCHLYQGYLYGKPMALTEFEDLVHQHGVTKD
ncbi:EAL domain-containing protein [Thiomicrospira microaerophila]|uniref:bifunctional diguanylate cyclase/phosphodiesterase n=1 Tax=Thiomicrospira microaerophila TaxID=406020 RepID=UPI00200E6B31|nr:bifunctional diguanylate cyclase/phosphodiesterase [Thiomicrospira microaerophila]UQB43072.1 EAL domain-containing protein [Thiomicrospira microaerophila]